MILSFLRDSNFSVNNCSITYTQILNQKSKGSLAGEGTSFFVLENEKRSNSYAELLDVKMLYKPSSRGDSRRRNL